MASGKWHEEPETASGQWPVASGEWPVASGGKLDEFMAYRKSLALFDSVVEDMNQWMNSHRVERLVSQQIASADSVCSNVEEGYGRESSVEYRRFLIIARGSLRETRGRYRRMRHWIPTEIVKQRMGLADEINRMLSATIQSLSGRTGKRPVASGHGACPPPAPNPEPRTFCPSPLAPRHLPLATCHLPLATCHLPLATCPSPLAPRPLPLMPNPKSPNPAPERWQLRLYVAGQTPKSITALSNLKKLCETHLAGRYQIEVIDLLVNPKLAAGDQILAIPTLVRKLPSPVKKIIGDLSNEHRVLVGLDLRAA